MDKMIMTTSTGMNINLLSVKPEDIFMADIAISLSRQARYLGHTSEFYSVAQHSVIVSKALPDGLKLWGLLHDAAEAYVGDIIHPIKKALPLFRAIEDSITSAIAEHFQLDGDKIPEDVKAVDTIAALTERRDLLHENSNQDPGWSTMASGLTPFTLPKIVPLQPKEAEDLFIRELKTLLAKREISNMRRRKY